LTSIFSCTLYHAFTLEDLKEVIDLATFLPELLKCSLVKVKRLLCNKTKAGENLKGHQFVMAKHKHQALQAQQVLDFVESKFQNIMEEILVIEEKVGTR
jgi:hypothetical protein